MVGDIIITEAKREDLLYLQIRLVHKYMNRHCITVAEFLQRDQEHNILGLLEEGYESYHLSGDEGILNEIDAIITVQESMQ